MAIRGCLAQSPKYSAIQQFDIIGLKKIDDFVYADSLTMTVVNMDLVAKQQVQTAKPSLPASVTASSGAQALEHGGMRAHVEDDGVFLIAFAEDLARGEDFAAQLLAIVGDAHFAANQLAREVFN